MPWKFGRSACLAGGFLLTAAGNCLASPLTTYSATVQDDYWGGKNSFTSTNLGSTPNVDVIASSGDPSFQIYSLTAARTGNNLTVTINTNYANHVGALGTGLGFLFLGAGAPTYNAGTTGNPVTGPNYQYDTYSADTARFQYAAGIPLTVAFSNGTASGSGVLYSVDSNTVQRSYYPNTSNTTGSNFRNDQAVGIKNSPSTVPSVSENWTVTKGNDTTGGTITFELLNLFNNTTLDSINGVFTLAWAMTCANDVILATIIPPETRLQKETPLPAALPLFAGGVGFLGLLSWRRKRKLAVATDAAA